VKQIMKILMVTFCMLNFSIIIFSGILDEFVYILDPDQLLVSDEMALNVLGMYLKYYEDGNIQFKTIADQSRTHINLYLEPDDSTILDILGGYQKGNEKDTINKIEAALKKYPNSVVVNSIRVIFLFNEYKNTKDIEISKAILSSLDIITKSKGENPFCVYYESIIRWDLSNDKEKEFIFSNLEKIFSFYSNNVKILELLISKAFELSKYDKIIQLAQLYEKEPQKSETILLLIAYSYNYSNEKEKARTIVDLLIQNSDKKNILSKSYELLGDISDTYTQKKKNYEISLYYDQKNEDSLAKLGLLLIQHDMKNNIGLSKIYLTKALIFDPDNEQIVNALKLVDHTLKKRNFIVTYLPLLIILVVILFILYKFLKEEKKIENGQQ